MNFKKHISIFLALFILLVNSSASLVLHYCHDQIAYVALVYQENKLVDSASEDSCCASDSVEDDGGCCSNEEIKVEKKVDYSLLKDFQFHFTAVTFPSYQEKNFDFKTNNYSKQENVGFYCDSHAPPLYKLYSQYVFYA